MFSRRLAAPSIAANSEALLCIISSASMLGSRGRGQATPAQPRFGCRMIGTLAVEFTRGWQAPFSARFAPGSQTPSRRALCNVKNSFYSSFVSRMWMFSRVQKTSAAAFELEFPHLPLRRMLVSRRHHFSTSLPC